jgi:TATA-box binding protein (TBP) (component of TFIID and TFIIIB)
MGSRLDLKKIALHARNAEYNPKARASPSVNQNTKFLC